MTAYRESGEAPCYKCDRSTRETCGTCSQPTCDKHLDARRQCGRCDEAYYRYMRADDGMMVTTSLVFVILGSLACGVLSPAMLPVAIGLPIVGFPIALVVRKRRKEARFFRQMRERGALPEAKTVDPDDAAAERLVRRLEKGLRKPK